MEAKEHPYTHDPQRFSFPLYRLHPDPFSRLDPAHSYLELLGLLIVDIETRAGRQSVYVLRCISVGCRACREVAIGAMRIWRSTGFMEVSNKRSKA